MSQSHLPADVRLWPDDPYALLDVPRSIDKRGARSAYTRLIRSFKPERFPDEFRRIREAYETVVEQVEWRAALGRSGIEIDSPPERPDADAELNQRRSTTASGDADEPDVAPEPMPDAAPPAAKSPAPWSPASLPGLSPEERARQQLADELDALWQRSCDGEHADVYARLLKLLARHPGHDAIVVRLYWLLYAAPELDPQRTATGWLVYGLRTNGLSGPLLELYRRAIAATPVEATRDRCTRLLQLPAAEPRALAALCEYRWLAAARLGQYQLIAADVSLLEARLKQADEALWAGLLFSAIDQLAWAPRGEFGPVLDQCCQQLERMHHVQSAYSHAFDRLDWLLQLAKDWRKLLDQRGLPEHVLQAVPTSWRGPDEEAQALGRRIVEEFAGSPVDSLRLLDRLWQGSPAVVAQLGGLIARQRHDDSDRAPDTRDEQLLAPLVREFLLQSMSDAYQYLRPKLLAFCIAESISPEQFVELVRQMPDLRIRQNQDLSDQLHSDQPLHYVHLAHEVFWS